MDPQMKRNSGPLRPQPARQSTPVAPLPPVAQSFSKVKIGLIVAAVIFFAVACIVVGRVFLPVTGVDKDKYQAVFLNNNRAFFGKLHNYGSNNPYMTDVYYFQVSGDAPAEKTSSVTQTLVKLRDEIHKPDDKLILSKDAILFVENLSGEGSVVQAIKEENS